MSADAGTGSYWTAPLTVAEHDNAVVALIFSLLSLASAVSVLSLYVFGATRRHSRLARIVTAHNHLIVLDLCASVFTSCSFVASSAFRLQGAAERSKQWCDGSLLILQLFAPAQVFLEIGFLAALAATAASSSANNSLANLSAIQVPRFVFHVGCAALAVSLASTIGFFFALPIRPGWGTRGDPTRAPWCVVPLTTSDGAIDKPTFAVEFAVLFVWQLALPVVGFACCAYAWRRLGGDGPRGVKAFIVVRGLYAAVHGGLWLVAQCTRFWGDTSGLAIAICLPTVPLAGAVIFFASEVAPRCWVVTRCHEDDDVGAGVEGLVSALSARHAAHRVNVEDDPALVDDAGDDHVRLTWDELTQAWTVDVTRRTQDSSDGASRAARALSRLLALRLVKVDRWKLAALLAFTSGLGDVVCVLLFDFFTAHITGNILLLGAAVSGAYSPDEAVFSEEARRTLVWRHAWGLPVYFVGICLANEIIRRNDATNGARALLTLQALFFWLAMIAARTVEGIGSDEWNRSAASWASSYLMVIGFCMTNAFQRSYLVGLPICTLQTGNNTSLATDLMVIIFALPGPGERKALFLKVRNTVVNIAAFFLGVVASTLAYQHIGSATLELLFAGPALLSLMALWLGWGTVET